MKQSGGGGVGDRDGGGKDPAPRWESILISGN